MIMEIGELLKAAWRAVEESGVPDALQEIAFKEAVEHLRARSPGASVPAASPPVPAASAPAAEQEPSSVPDVDFFARLVDETDIAEDHLRSLLHFDGQDVDVLPTGSRLGTTKSERVKTIVPLVAGSRHAGLRENDVPVDAIHRVCRDKAAMDGNFSKHMQNLKAYRYVSKKRLVSVGANWVPEFKAAVNKLLGSGEQP